MLRSPDRVCHHFSPKFVDGIIGHLSRAEHAGELFDFTDAVFLLSGRYLLEAAMAESDCARLTEAFLRAEASVSRNSTEALRRELAVGRDAILTRIRFWRRHSECNTAEEFNAAFLATIKAERFFHMLECIGGDRLIAVTELEIAAAKNGAAASLGV